jgi:hypothetical protein
MKIPNFANTIPQVGLGNLAGNNLWGGLRDPPQTLPLRNIIHAYKLRLKHVLRLIMSQNNITIMGF